MFYTSKGLMPGDVAIPEYFRGSVCATFTGRRNYDYWEAAGAMTPRYHARLRRKEFIPPTDYVNTTAVQTASGTWSLYSGPGADPYHTSYDACLWLVQPTAGSVDNRSILLQSAVARLNMGGWDALTWLAQLHQLKTLVRDLAKSLLKLAKSLYAKYVRALERGVDLATAISEIWLWWRFALRPLIYDIQDIAKLVEKMNATMRPWYSAKSTVISQDLSLTRSFTVERSWGRVGVEYSGAFRVTEYVTAYRLTTPPRVVVSLPKTAWELVPGSFVIDWIIDIGTWIDACEGMSLSKETPHWFAYSRREDLECEATLNSGLAYYATWSGVQTETASWKSLKLQRSLLTPENIGMPVIALRLDAGKVMDLVALALGFINRIPAVKRYMR